MSKTTEELLSVAECDEFCAGLETDTKRLVVANCIEGELSALGCADTRAGSSAFERARRVAVSTIVRNEIDLDELGGMVLPFLDQILDEEQAETERKRRRARVGRFADSLRE